MKKLLAIIAAMALIVSVTACGDSSQQGTEVSGESPSSAATPTESGGNGVKAGGQKQTISIEAVAGVYGEVFVDTIPQEFLDELGVEMVFTASGTVETFSKQMMEFSQGASTADLVLLEPAWLGDYYSHLEPLEPLCEKYGVELYMDDVVEKYRDVYFKWDGVRYTVGFDGDQYNLIYNTIAFEDERNKADFLAEYGYELAPPKTFDEYVEMAHFFQGRDWDFDGQPEYGTSETWLSGGYAAWAWLSKFAAYGGIYFDEEMNPLLTTQNAKDALNITMSIIDAVPPGTTSAGYTEVEAAFCNGDIAFCNIFTSVVKAAMNPDVSRVVGNVGIEVVPGAYVNGEFIRRPTLPTGFSIGIPKYISEEKKELALRLLEYMCQPERSLEISMYHPAAADAWRQSTFDSPRWQELYADTAPGLGLKMIQVMKETVETGLVDLQIPGTDEYIQALDREISAAITGRKTPDQALQDASAAWDAITDRYGRESQKAAWNTQYKAIKAAGIEYIPYQ